MWYDYILDWTYHRHHWTNLVNTYLCLPALHENRPWENIISKTLLKDYINWTEIKDIIQLNHLCWLNCSKPVNSSFFSSQTILNVNVVWNKTLLSPIFQRVIIKAGIYKEPWFIYHKMKPTIVHVWDLLNCWRYKFFNTFYLNYMYL